MLLGPLQCLTFLLNHGLLAASLGAFWSVQAHWALSVPAAALVRVGGQLAYIALTSWTLNENLFALLMSNVYSLLVRAASLLRHLLECTMFTAQALYGQNEMAVMKMRYVASSEAYRPRQACTSVFC